MNSVTGRACVLILCIAIQALCAQGQPQRLNRRIADQTAERSPGPAPQQSSPMVDYTRPHTRLLQQQVPGKRIKLWIGTLYLSPGFRARPRVPLVMHFHGAPWLVEHHIMHHWPEAALISVHLGAGSSIYSQAFAESATFDQLLADALGHLRLATRRKVKPSRIVLSSFSAGYGAIRSILQQPGHYAQVNTVFLADSLHTSYSPEGAPPKLESTPLESFVRFANDAAQGRKRMWITHSEVYPGTYASTTETADYLIDSLQAKRRPVLLHGPVGTQQLSRVSVGNFRLSGFAGNSAPDHMDHLYAMGDWFEEMRRYAK